MKKFFALAIAAIAFVSCSSESTEELAQEAGITRAHVRNGLCDVRGELCDVVVNPNNYTPAAISEHSHCEKVGCRYYYEAMNQGRMSNHVQDANAHGFEGDHEGGHGIVR